MGKVGNVEAEWNIKAMPCCGEWTLKVNGKDVSDKIPEGLKQNYMKTRKEYKEWYFDENYLMAWRNYEDGLDCEDWIDINGYWLNKIVADKNIQKCIFHAINEEDWRYNSCGKCS